MNNKVVIFDCDGTILDTFLLIEKTMFQSFKEVFPNYKLTLDEAHSFFGPFINDTIKSYTDDYQKQQEFIRVYERINTELMPKYICAYDGIKELLKALKEKGYKIAVLSNKVSKAISLGLEICKIDEYIDLIVGAKDVKNPKPNPEGIYKIMEYFNTKDAIMVGDSVFDIETGNNASIPTIGVTWCKTTKETFLIKKATYVVDHPLEILKVLGERYV